MEPERHLKVNRKAVLQPFFEALDLSAALHIDYKANDPSCLALALAAISLSGGSIATTHGAELKSAGHPGLLAFL